jgi:hypothetical protein
MISFQMMLISPNFDENLLRNTLANILGQVGNKESVFGYLDFKFIYIRSHCYSAMSKYDSIINFANQVIQSEGISIGVPVVIDEITFVPIIKEDKPREERDYITLSEALDQDLCEVIEKGTEIAHVEFINKGDEPILIEEGEIFLGQGTQDRIVVSTVMVQPDVKIEIPVKCVHAPHSLARGAKFMHGGKASRSFLGEMRKMKYASVMSDSPVSTINQSQVWNKVATETAGDDASTDHTQYTQTVQKRMEKAEKRSKEAKFPVGTIGLGVVNQEGKVKGLEIHRSPHNFRMRKPGFFTSIESHVEWNKGKEAAQADLAKTRVLEVFKKLISAKQGKEITTQIEVDGLIINLEEAGITGEVLSSQFYSKVCPKCGAMKKKRISKCAECGFEEQKISELAYMSLM